MLLSPLGNQEELEAERIRGERATRRWHAVGWIVVFALVVVVVTVFYYLAHLN